MTRRNAWFSFDVLRFRCSLRSFAIAIVVWGGGAQRLARAHTPARPSQPAWQLSAAATPWFQGTASVGRGGSFWTAGVVLRGSVDGPIGDRERAGLTISYDYTAYDFSSPGVLGQAKPWTDVQHLGVGPMLLLLGPAPWSFFVRPSVDFFLEDGADWGESLIYGAVLGVSRNFGPDRRIGLGLSTFYRLEQFSALPFPFVDWRLTNRLRLMNPLQAGPTGGAGLELAFDPGGRFTLGGGGAYRSIRFRLRGDGPFPSGIGEEHAILAFVHAGARLGRIFTLDGYAGALLGGALRVEDSGGHRISERGFDPAPLVGATVTGRF
jgi:hypothetical protein